MTIVASGIHVNFGGVQALGGVDLEVRRGEIVGLLGPNGAGKTTCFNAMTGVYTPTEGAIRFKGKEIAGTKPHKINQLGIARTFQNIRLFPEMTAMENVMVGCDARHKTSVLGVLFRAYRVRPTEDQLPEAALVRSYGGEVRIMPLVPGRSTTDIIRRIRESEDG